ncbi:MAG: cyclic 2,3-diphosphoglycerate synthase [Planctomycetota bacterium]|nr:cyclic 2,3-diphosphoglycerate synthase [Planctomycetota bacterium]MDI6787250.1 cyclic 2,3-diphosphoglycerate synthase [Planctomycetota bacterium]
MRKKILIMGAAGRDFHVFNTLYKDNQDYEIVCFTATQIPNIDNRLYPPELAGPLYPAGIPIKPEQFLIDIIRETGVSEVIFAYSDVSYEYIKGCREKVEKEKVQFILLDPTKAMLKSNKPVIAVCAVRTGSGKSQTSRRVVDILKKYNKKVAVVRHPMPYGNLLESVVQRFETFEDLIRHNCTIEEREEYEPHLHKGVLVYAGVDYEKILRAAEKEVDVIVWDGGNNDTSFYKPDLHITVCDPLRSGHELLYYPGRINFEMADVLVINKVDVAKAEDVESILKNAQQYNPSAVVIMANSPVFVSDPDKIKDKRVLVIEDGPTVTHGEMPYGAGFIAAKKYQAKEIVDPRPYASGTIKQVFEQYPQTTMVLPAVGYHQKQIKDLEETIERCPCDVVIIATPINLGRVIKINKPWVRVTYELEEISKPRLENIITQKLGITPLEMPKLDNCRISAF